MNNKFLLVETGSGHTHTVELDENGNGISSVNGGHSHEVNENVVLPAMNTDGHTHSIQIFEGFGTFQGINNLLLNNKLLILLIIFLIIVLYRFMK